MAKKYEVIIGADTSEAMAALNKLKGAADKMLKGAGLSEGLRSDIEKFSKDIGRVRSEVSAGFDSINNSIKSLDASTVKSEFTGMADSVDNSIKLVTQRIEALHDAFKTFEGGSDFTGLQDALKASTSGLSDNIDIMLSKMKELGDFMQSIKTGALNVGSVDSSSPTSSIVGSLENDKSRLKSIIETIKDDFYSIKEISDISPNEIDMSSLISYISELEEAIDLEKKLKSAGVDSSYFNSLYDQDISSSSIKNFKKDLSKQKTEIEKLRKVEVGDTSFDKEVRFRVRLDEDAEGQAFAESISKKLEDAVQGAQAKIKPIKIPIEIDKDSIKDLTTESKDIVKDVKESVKKEAKKKIDTESLEPSATPSQVAGTTTISGGTVHIDNDNLATESTLASIAGMLSGWDKDGTPQPKTAEQIKQEEVASEAVDYLTNLYKMNGKLRKNMIAGDELKNAQLREELNNKRDYLIETRDEAKKLKRKGGKRIAKNPNLLKNSDYYNAGVTVNGVEYAKYGSFNGENVELTKWQANLDKIVADGADSVSDYLEKTVSSLNRYIKSNEESSKTLGLEYGKDGKIIARNRVAIGEDEISQVTAKKVSDVINSIDKEDLDYKRDTYKYLDDTQKSMKEFAVLASKYRGDKESFSESDRDRFKSLYKDLSPFYDEAKEKYDATGTFGKYGEGQKYKSKIDAFVGFVDHMLATDSSGKSKMDNAVIDSKKKLRAAENVVRGNIRQIYDEVSSVYNRKYASNGEAEKLGNARIKSDDHYKAVRASVDKDEEEYNLLRGAKHTTTKESDRYRQLQRSLDARKASLDIYRAEKEIAGELSDIEDERSSKSKKKANTLGKIVSTIKDKASKRMSAISTTELSTNKAIEVLSDKDLQSLSDSLGSALNKSKGKTVEFDKLAKKNVEQRIKNLKERRKQEQESFDELKKNNASENDIKNARKNLDKFDNNIAKLSGDSAKGFNKKQQSILDEIKKVSNIDDADVKVLSDYLKKDAEFELLSDELSRLEGKKKNSDILRQIDSVKERAKKIQEDRELMPVLKDPNADALYSEYKENYKNKLYRDREISEIAKALADENIKESDSIESLKGQIDEELASRASKHDDKSKDKKPTKTIKSVNEKAKNIISGYNAEIDALTSQSEELSNEIEGKKAPLDKAKKTYEKSQNSLKKYEKFNNGLIKLADMRTDMESKRSNVDRLQNAVDEEDARIKNLQNTLYNKKFENGQTESTVKAAIEQAQKRLYGYEFINEKTGKADFSQGLLSQLENAKRKILEFEAEDLKQYESERNALQRSRTRYNRSDANESERTRNELLDKLSSRTEDSAKSDLKTFANDVMDYVKFGGSIDNLPEYTSKILSSFIDEERRSAKAQFDSIEKEYKDVVEQKRNIESEIQQTKQAKDAVRENASKEADEIRKARQATSGVDTEKLVENAKNRRIEQEKQAEARKEEERILRTIQGLEKDNVETQKEANKEEEKSSENASKKKNYYEGMTQEQEEAAKALYKENKKLRGMYKKESEATENEKSEQQDIVKNLQEKVKATGLSLTRGGYAEKLKVDKSDIPKNQTSESNVNVVNTPETTNSDVVGVLDSILGEVSSISSSLDTSKKDKSKDKDGSDKMSKRGEKNRTSSKEPKESKIQSLTSQLENAIGKRRPGSFKDNIIADFVQKNPDVLNEIALTKNKSGHYGYVTKTGTKYKKNQQAMDSVSAEIAKEISAKEVKFTKAQLESLSKSKAQTSAKGSSKDISSEASALENVAKAATSAASAKEGFADANSKVADSANKSSEKLKDESEKIENVEDSSKSSSGKKSIHKEGDTERIKNKLYGNLRRSANEYATALKNVNNSNEENFEINKKAAAQAEVAYKARLEAVKNEFSSDERDFFVENNVAEKIASQTNKIQNAIEETRSSLKSLEDISFNNGLGSDFKNFSQNVEALNSDLEKGKISLSEYYNKMKTIQDGESMSYRDQMRTFNNKNVRNSKFFDGEYENVDVAYNAALNDAKSRGKLLKSKGFGPEDKLGISSMTAQIQMADGQIQKLEYTYSSAMKRMGAQTTNLDKKLTGLPAFADKLKNRISDLGTYWIARMFDPMDLIRYAREAFTVVEELDNCFTEMQKVSNESADSLRNYQRESFNIAGDIGVTAQEVQRSTADFMRLGYNLGDASKLAKDANIYANVGDMDVDTATEHMVSSIKAWSSEFNNDIEASTAIIDKYNEVGNNFAITSADIGSAMERSAAALKEGGNTLDESIGLITAGNLIQQDADTTANALKVMSLRIRGSKTDLEDMGEETDGLASSTSKLREEVMALSGVDIMKNENEYKSTAEIIKEIGAVYGDMTDVSQAALLEKLAGKTRASTVAGLLENYKLIDEVIESSANAEGSAAKENEKYMESIQGRMAILKNSGTELLTTFINSDGIKSGISMVTSLTDAVTKLANIPFSGEIATLLGIGGFATKSIIGGVFKGVDVFSDAVDTDGLKNTLKYGVTQAFDPFMTSIVAATAAGYGLYKVLDIVNSEWTRSQESVKDARTEYENIESELDSLNSQKENNKKAVDDIAFKYDIDTSNIDNVGEKISTLRDSANIMLVDDAELQKIEMLNSSLESTIALKEGLADQKENLLSDVAESAANTEKSFWEQSKEEYGAFFGMMNYIGATIGGLLGGDSEKSDWAKRDTTNYGLAQQALEDYNNAKKEQAEIEGVITQKKAEGIDISEQESKQYEYSKQQVSEQAAILSSYSDILSEEMNNFLDSEGNIIDSRYAEIVNSRKELLSEIATVDMTSKEKNLFNLNNFFDGSDGANAVKERLTKSLVDFRKLKGEYSDAVSDYNAEVEAARDTGADLTETMYGNIDLQNRARLDWTDKNLNRYKDALMSWESANSKWEDIYKGYKDSYSTVDAGSSMFSSSNGDSFEVAFTPVMTTDDHKAVMISKNQMYDYINTLISEVEKQGDWSFDDILKLDKEGIDGFEADGYRIKNVLAGIGDDAIRIGNTMHYIGKDGSIADAYSRISKAAEDAGMDMKTFLENGESTALLENLEDLGLTLDDLNVDNVDDLVEYFNKLAIASEQAQNSLDEYRSSLSDVEAAQSSANQDADWSSFQSALANAKELRNQGKTGTDDFETVVEHMLSQGGRERLAATVEQYKKEGKEAALAYQEAFERQEATYSRYFGEDEQASLQNFAHDLQSKGLFDISTVTTESGKQLESIQANFKSTSEAADALGISVESVEELLHGMEAYGYDFDIDFSGENLKEAESSLTGMQDLLLEMGDDRWSKAYSGMYDGWNEIKDDLSDEQVVQIKFEYDIMQLQNELNSSFETSETTGTVEDWVKTRELANKMKSEMLSGFSSSDVKAINDNDAFKMAGDAYNSIQSKYSDKLSADQRSQMAESQSIIARAQTDMLNRFNETRSQMMQAGKDPISFEDWIDTAGGIEALDTFNQKLESAKNNLPKDIELDVDADTSNVEAGIASVVDNANGKTITMEVDAKVDQVQQQINSLEVGNTLEFTAKLSDGSLANVSAELGAEGQTITYTVNEVLGEEVPVEDEEKIVTVDEVAGEQLDLSPENKQVTVDFTGNNNATFGVNVEGQDALQQLKDTADGIVSKDETVSVLSMGGPQAESLAGSIAKINSKTATITTIFKTIGSPPPSKIDGTAHLGGTAFASGNITDDSWINNTWRSAPGGGTLVGEQGAELVVDPKTNHWYTVGDYGAEFVNLPHNAVVFDASQTKELLEKGSINGRAADLGGRPAMLSGNANLFSTASGGGSSSGGGNKSSSSGNSSGGDDSSEKDKENLTDWIKVLLDRTSRLTELAVDNIDRTIGLVNKQAATLKAMTQVQTEITKNQEAAKKYLDYFNATGISEVYKNKIKNGELNIEDIQDEDLRDKLSKAQDYYESYLDATDHVLELQDQMQELAIKRLENIEEEYDSLIEINDAINKIADSAEKLNDAMGFDIDSKFMTDNIQKALNAQFDTYEQSVKKLNETQAEYDSLIASGKLNQDSVAAREWRANINEFQAEVYDAATALTELKEKINDLKIELIQFRIDESERKIDKLQAKISLQQSRNDLIPEDEYVKQIDENNKIIDDSYKKRQKLIEKQAVYAVNSNEYQELQKQINDLDISIYGALEDNEKLKDSIYENRMIGFENQIKQYGYLNDEISDLLDLVGDEEGYFDKAGRVTENGAAALSLYAQQMILAKDKVSDYQVTLEKLEELYEAGIISEQEYTEQSEEYRDSLRDSALEVDKLKDSIADLYVTQMEKENEALQKVIDKRKEALNKKKEYYEYDKKIKNQSKDLNALRAQAAALEGVNNATAKAQLKKIQQQIKDAEEELDETKRNHAYDMQSQGYDKLAEDLDQIIDDTKYSLSHNAEFQENTVQNMLNNIVSMYSEAYGKINSIISSTGIVKSSEFSNSHEQASTQSGASQQKQEALVEQSNNVASKEANDIVTSALNLANVSAGSFSGNANTNNTRIEAAIDKERDESNRKIAEVSLSTTSVSGTEGTSSETFKVRLIRPTDAKESLQWRSKNTSIATVSGNSDTYKISFKSPGSTTVEAYGSNGVLATVSVKVNPKPAPPPPAPTQNTSTNKLGDGKARVGDKATLKSGKWYYYDSWGASPAGRLYNGVKHGVIIDSYSNTKYGGTISQTGAYDVHIKSADGKYPDLGWVQLNELEDYKTGAKKIDKDKLAWTQENGDSEIIYRKSDGAMLTSLGKGDTIFSHENVQTLWNILNGNTNGINGLFGGNNSISLPNVSSTNSYGDVNFTMGDIVINDAVDATNVMSVIKANIKTVAKDVSNQMYQDARKTGLRKSF